MSLALPETEAVKGPRVVVAGGGMAGLCAALAAAEAGADVTLIEKSHSLGGSLRLSGGLVWTYADDRTAERLVPLGDPLLQHLVIGELTDDLAWLEGNGVELGQPARSRPHSIGREISPVQFIDAMSKSLDEHGVAIALDAGLASISRDERGQVNRFHGVAGRKEATSLTIETDAVILATGGFQGNPELVRRLLGVRPENVQLRANRWSTGDGLLAAQGIGAALSPGIAQFYGHALAAPPAVFPPELMREASQFYGNRGLALNLAGRRFVDEAAGVGEEHVNAALALQPAGRGFYVVDAAAADSTAGPGVHVQTAIDRAIAYGAPYAKASTLEGLCDQLGQFGVARANALDTLTSYRCAMVSGQQVDLHPRRSSDLNVLATAPFQAVGVQAGLTFTMGGLAVDAECRVLSRSRSTSSLTGPLDGFNDDAAVPIGGLFAAGCDLGGVNYGGYMGGLAAALVTGRTAGKGAACRADGYRD